MDFLRKLFSIHKHHNPPKIQLELISRAEVQVHQQQISTLLSYQHTCSSSSSFQSSHKSNSLNSLLNMKILHFYQLKQQQVNYYPDLGVLVGMIGQQKCNQKYLEFCNVVKIGQFQEINSLKALRKKSLDSLIVFYNQVNSFFDLKQIILAEQRLILVVQSRCLLQNLIQSLESIVYEIYEEKPLNECVYYLCFSVIPKYEKYYVEFKHHSFFLENFRNSLKKINVQFSDENQFLRLIKLIKFKDYLDFRQCEPTAIKKILRLKQQIQTESQNEKRKVEMRKLSSLLSTCENEDEQQADLKPVRKNSSMQVDIQAEYFKKRMSQKRETQTNQGLIQTAELFYFIEQRDDNQSSDDENDNQNKWSQKNKVKTEKKKYCKSQHAIDSEKEDDIDEQFFRRQ